MDDDFVAPACRAAFSLDDLTLGQVTPMELKLFDAAVTLETWVPKEN